MQDKDGEEHIPLRNSFLSLILNVTPDISKQVNVQPSILLDPAPDSVKVYSEGNGTQHFPSQKIKDTYP